MNETLVIKQLQKILQQMLEISQLQLTVQLLHLKLETRHFSIQFPDGAIIAPLLWMFPTLIT
jgi:hypothetical protein